MGDGRNERPLFFANLEDLHHEGDVVVLFEPFGDMLLEHGRRKGPKRFAPLDLAIQNVLHVRAARIAEDRAVAERARTPFHPPLKPADDLAFGDRRRRAPAEFSLVRDFFDRAARFRDLLLALGEERIDLPRENCGPQKA